jgi:L-alanine-DL-glutamate epimerase-like enolase superfamily enzyme
MTSGQGTWSARCVETRTAGAAGGPGKPTGSNPGRAPRSDPTVLRVPLRRPLSDAVYHRTHWLVPVVEVETSDGLVGTGYSGLWSGADLLMRAIEAHIAPMLIGQDPRDIARLWDEVYWSPLHWVGRAGVVHMAYSMVDVALWDLAAQRAQVPLWRLLGGRHRQLGTYNTDGGWLNFTTDELVEDTGRIVKAGWQRVKMKVGGPDPALDMARVAAVRRSLPDSVLLMVDVNQRWDLTTARRLLPRLAEYQVDWVEEPLHPDDVRGHAELAAARTVPVALGENLYSAEAFTAFLDAGAVDIVQVDVTRVAGVTEWLRIAHHAQERGRWVVPHAGDMMQVHQHLMAGIGDAREPLIEYLPWALEIFAEPVRVEAGHLTLPETPGASTRILPEARARFAA